MNRFPSATAVASKPSGRSLLADDFSPRRLALNFAPKMIVVEFTRRSTGKLYQKRVKLSPNVIQKTPEAILRALRTRYPVHFGKAIKEEQLLRLLQRLVSDDRPAAPNTSQLSKRLRPPQDRSSTKKDALRDKENSLLGNSDLPFKLKSSLYDQVVSNESLFAKKENRGNTLAGDTTPLRPSTLAAAKKSSTKKERALEVTPEKSEESIPEDFVEDFEEGFDEIGDEEIATPAKKPVGWEHSGSKSKSLLLSELKGVDLLRDDLNKANARDIAKAKKQMDEQFVRNHVDAADPGFEYDKRAEFEANESNEWDEELLDDF